MFLINVFFTIIFGLFVFKPSELKFKKIFIYTITCLLFSRKRLHDDVLHI